MSADDARRLFDGMRIWPPPVSGADHISALPDNVLQDILSLLPAQEAVRTCVLARSWLHLWRSTAGLRLVGRDGPGPAEDLRNFVDNILNLRDQRTDLHTVEIRFSGYSADDLPFVSRWIRSVVMCKARSLTFRCSPTRGHSYQDYLCLDGMHLAFPHLRTLDLLGVCVQDTFLDFATCPALEDLKMHECDISVDKISSSSLHYLIITDCVYLSNSRIHVSAPSLVSLELDDCLGIAPSFENMVLLETACVNLASYYPDICLNYFGSGVFCGADNGCPSCDNYSDVMLLCGISGARHLELISVSENLIFAKDLVHRPIFSNVKTLLLNEYWCVAPGCDRLAYILKNSPVLEKLTLEIFSKGPNHKVEMNGSYRMMEGPSAISERLKIVQVKCNAVDERILEVLKFLRAFNIRFSSEEA